MAELKLNELEALLLWQLSKASIPSPYPILWAISISRLIDLGFAIRTDRGTVVTDRGAAFVNRMRTERENDIMWYVGEVGGDPPD
jgi:hypothetical protein